MKKKKIITYFVAGGHGTTACKEAWEQPENDTETEIESHLCIGVVDDGGHSGLLRKIFEKINEPYIPLGDLRNIWADSVKNDVLSQLIQKRVSTTENLADLKDILILELKALKSLVLIYCKNGEAIEKYLSNNDIEDFVASYIHGLTQLLKSNSAESIYNKHNIGNLFFAAITFTISHKFSKNPYSIIGDVVKEICLFPQNIRIHLMDNKRLDLLIQNSRGEIVLKGEGEIDNIDFPVRVESYEAFDPVTKKRASKVEEIVKLIKASDLIVIPPGSETNSYPWVKYYAKELNKKILVRIVNLTIEQSSLGFIEEAGFLESLGLKPIYLYPQTFTKIKNELGEEQYFKLVAKYSLQNKRAQDLSTQTILMGLKLGYPQILEKNHQVKIEDRILNIIDVQAFFQNGQHLQEFGRELEDDPYISQKGFRHSTLQLKELIHKIAKMSNLSTKEIISSIK